jgi:hypothetical protein
MGRARGGGLKEKMTNNHKEILTRIDQEAAHTNEATAKQQWGEGEEEEVTWDPSDVIGRRTTHLLPLLDIPGETKPRHRERRKERKQEG